MALDESKYPRAYINPFMDKLYEWGYAEGLWEDKRELLQCLDGDVDDGPGPSESLKSFLLKNDIPEWYYKNGWGMSIGAGHPQEIINAWEENWPYGHFYGEGSENLGGADTWPQQLGDIKVTVAHWDNSISCVAIIRGDGEYEWWYNPIIFTPTPGKSWFGDTKVRPNFYLLNWKENPFDSIK